MTFHCWVFRRWVFEAYCREYPTRNLELGIPAVAHSRRWVSQILGIPFENRSRFPFFYTLSQAYALFISSLLKPT